MEMTFKELSENDKIEIVGGTSIRTLAVNNNILDNNINGIKVDIEK